MIYLDLHRTLAIEFEYLILFQFLVQRDQYCQNSRNYCIRRSRNHTSGIHLFLAFNDLPGFTWDMGLWHVWIVIFNGVRKDKFSVYFVGMES